LLKTILSGNGALKYVNKKEYVIILNENEALFVHI